MRYRVLGPTEVLDRGQWHALGAAKQRVLLSCLLVDANRFVSADALVCELWGDSVPSSAAKSLQVYVHRLRYALGGGQELLRTRPGGYELRVAPGELDAERFCSLAAEGRAALANGRPQDAVVALSEGLGLWRGRAFADVPSTPRVQAEASRLEETRLTAWQDLADAKIATGRSRELVAELDALVTEQPLREALWIRLVHALHQSGQRAQALRAYATARTVLRDELGLDPGPGLRDAHRRVLADGGRPVRGSICELPPDLPDFTGRAAELRGVLALLGQRPATPAAASYPWPQDAVPGRQDRAPQVVVVTGMAGTGKSAFAVHAAHLLREAFPDGQLYADLREAAQDPAGPEAVLGSLLQAGGVPAAAPGTGLDALARRYRGELADRRVLLVLDNATDAQQVRQLLPGTGSAAVLVTSRGRLAGLAGARHIQLGLFDDAEALTLLARATGDDRTLRAPGAAARITRLCGNLPLAVRVAGVRLAGRPHLTPLRLAGALTDDRRRLDELTAGDLDVRSAFDVGYRALGPAAGRAFRLLGLLDADSVPPWAVRVLLGSSVNDAEAAMNSLIDHGLLEAVRIGGRAGEPRLRMHHLVRVYAREQAATQEPPGARAAAVDRVCAAYLAAAQRAARGLASEMAGVMPGPGPRPVHWPGPRPPAWLEAEHPTVSSLVGQADPGTAWRLAAGLADYFESVARFDEWRATHETALSAARRADDLLGEAAMERGLGEVNTVQDRYTDAIACFQRSLRAYRLHGGSDPGEAAAGAGLGVLLRLRGRHNEAVSCLNQAIASARRTNNTWAQAYAECALGTVHLERGAADDARTAFERSLVIAAATGYRSGEYSALRCLGLAELARGRLAAAHEQLEQARRIAAGQGNLVGEIHARQWLGHLADVGGDPEYAERTLLECLAAYRGFGERFGEALTLRNLADLHLHVGRPAQAQRAARQSLAIWHHLGSPYWTARTLDVVAQLPGEASGADRARRQATALRTSMGLSPALRPTAAAGRRKLGGHLVMDAR